ncbi:phosphatidylinositol 4-phosphate 3-kinase C2 domain-containing subunit beta isoform X3 [Nilaparvata lugens]|nr:phosphatidylinositol 4-phosphate 3-kinase C2 domain-containing subunit beta isoform X2 [Nilaparvata lugens]XP_039295234.1 phosphatidylinositol 4-phosphate 3-kinase C2 domain-containing subunit beta isoform X3 [Nilaparvata lugens]
MLQDSSSSNQPSGLDVLKVVEKRDNSNLIDLSLFDNDILRPTNKDGDRGVRVSLLEAFDPLLIMEGEGAKGGEEPAIAEEPSHQDSDSIYDPYDPFEYMYSPPSLADSDPIYAAVVKATPTSPPPPLPPRNAAPSSPPPSATIPRSIRQSKVYENALTVKRRTTLQDADLIAFHKMVKKLREEFVYSDQYTNAGLVVSPTLESSYNEGTSIKLVVKCPGREMPVTFTCDVSSTVEHVIMHVVCELEEAEPDSDYVLKVGGLCEYLTNHTTLADYDYVHQCIKLEQDVRLVLVHVEQLQRPLARTAQDDKQDKLLSIEDLLPKEPVQPISYDTLTILLETLEGEMDKLEKAEREGVNPLKSLGVVQAVKAVCSLLGNVETLELTHALDLLIAATSPNQEDDWVRPEVMADEGDYSVVRLGGGGGASGMEMMRVHCDRIRDAVQALIETYCNAFRVDFQLKDSLNTPAGSKLSSEVLDSVLVHVGCLHRLDSSWTHQEFLVAGQLYHGTRPVGHPVLSKIAAAPPATNKYNRRSADDRVPFDCWLNFEGVNVCVIPRECRLVLVIYGRSVDTPSTSNEPGEGQAPNVTQVELGWAAIQFFNYDGWMTQGSFLLSVWPPAADKRLGPAPVPGTHPHGDIHPVLGVELPDYGGRIMFPPINSDMEIASGFNDHDFDSLDHNTQQQLNDIVAQDTFSWPQVEDREVLWEKRHYLLGKPQALPKVFLAAHSWDYACLADLYSLLHSWTPLDPVSALQLLLPCFPDSEVRRVAVWWVRELSSDELCDYLPQLVQALKHETYETSSLAHFLLQRALTSPRVAHHLYWLLTQALPGECPQNTGSSTVSAVDDEIIGACYHRRLQLILRALLSISGEALRQRFMSQQILVKELYDVAESVKATKESLRMKTLASALEELHHSLQASATCLQASATCLPLSPSLQVAGIQVRTCSYFPSNTLPLKINFLSVDGDVIPAIFKVGDDLQQDMLTLQMIRIMDKLWLKEGLDLKMVTFSCVPTGNKRGMIEMVTEAETLRKIQVELGLTGSFKDRPIAEWLAKHNPSALEYERAVANFTASCAGYSVATYILGICDRHNDNIMLKMSGHLFHIDFGKFLGDAQMFGNFKRDRTPFVLTSDMAYVINGGDKPSVRFHHFVDLCCQAFNIVRKHGNLILNLFGLMASSGIPGVTVDAVRYVQRALMLEVSNAEAAATFARFIQSSLKSWFTQFNFFLHNLAQLRFSTEASGDDNGQLLSFVPRTYSMQQEGRLKSVEVYGCQKRYAPEKYYVYILRVERASQPDPSYLFRNFKEFVEFQQKLCILFPLAKCHSLQSTSLHVGRSNIKQVAEKRRHDIKQFLCELFKMADEICHSDLVYTFFHPLLRDQQEADIHEAKLRGGVARSKEREASANAWRLTGQIKLSVHYQRGTLMVMVHHVRDLACIAGGGQEPSPYVKVYLQPDPQKATKRKTKVVRRSCHPSFMEMLEYRMPLEVVQHRTLQATVWNHDPLQENEFLGGISLSLSSLDLSQETVNWFTLGNIHR